MSRMEWSRASQGTVGVVDLGTSKVCCLIAGPDAEGRLTLQGLGHQRATGLKSGMIVDVDEAERSVRAAVAQAERMAGIRLERVVVSVACGRLKSQTFVARAAAEGQLVTAGDIDRVIAGGEAYVARSGRMLIQLTRSDWRLDGAGGIRDPRGLAGRDLSVELTAVTADEAPVRNVLSVIERCHLATDGLVATPFASAISVTTAEERRVGVLLVDIGAGVTSLAAFSDGRLIFADAIPVGGHHVTYDIARALSTPVAEAERIKALYGTLVKAASDATEQFSFPILGEEEPSLYHTSKARLREIIEPRIEGLFGLVEERLHSAGLSGLLAGRVALTGGGSQIMGLDQSWARRFGGNAYCGRPRPIGRMSGNMCSPAFATAIGLVVGEATHEAQSGLGRRSGYSASGYLGRVKQWISESF